MFTIFHGYHLVEKIHMQNLSKRFKQSNYLRMLGCAILALIICWLPADTFGIEGLTVIEQRVIALFVFAATMWLCEALPAWGTSFLIIVIMLLTVSDAPV